MAPCSRPLLTLDPALHNEPLDGGARVMGQNVASATHTETVFCKAQPCRRGRRLPGGVHGLGRKPKPASTSLFEWAFSLERQEYLDDAGR